MQVKKKAHKTSQKTIEPQILQKERWSFLANQLRSASTTWKSEDSDLDSVLDTPEAQAELERKKLLRDLQQQLNELSEPKL